MKKTIGLIGRASIGAAVVASGMWLGTTAAAPEAQAGPCGGGMAFGSGGSQCDGNPYPDGSFDRCVSTYVLGFGGWNCFRVYPPAP
ncbi:hypothetical protein LV457_13365 [Mycobacterium sp. MYCO198283]|uniref:CDGP domain-containing protein n=1 Tax=Mycobacterium sp. MYCO198283 TaxID=2883505 RepID=UPI001E3578D5|nr:hypothetical protein [Mycobacterium sp. MYCO198283]MCG5433268.1 hypothetical protein [Mycobacterium sp. MYCO198283]